jgi:hypothetical protein
MSSFPPKGKTWYNKQAEALAQHENVILVKWGNFNFTTFFAQDEFVEFIEETPEKDRHFYEVLRGGQPQRMFADLDGEGLSVSRIELLDKWEKLMQQVFVDVGMDYKANRVRWLQSSGEKISYHWSYNESFKNCDDQKLFWKYVEHVIERDYSELCFLRTRADDKMELMTVLDISVYSKERAFRTYNSTKQGCDRVLKPIRFKDDKIKRISNFEPLEYLVYDPEATTFLELEIPVFEKIKNRFLTQDDILKLVYKHVPNTKLYDTVGRMFKLKNDGIRMCIINGEENTTDNSYVIWRRDGLYFGCHDAGCEGCLKAIVKFDSVQQTKQSNSFDFTDPYTYQSFQNQFKEHNFKSYADLKQTMMAWHPRVIARILHGEGSYVKKSDDAVNVVRKLGQSGFNMYYTDNDKPKTLGLADFLYKLDGYGNLDVKLDHTDCKKTNFNLWNGFQAQRVNLELLDEPTRNGLAQMKAFVLETWASGDEAIYRYIISWFAGLVTNLKSINMVALAMVAKQGTGKGFFLQFMKYIIRGINICETQGIGSITQKHNTAIQNKRLVVINEMSSTRDEFKSNFDKIKTYITDPVVQIEPKGVDPYQITNISNFLLFTNHRDSIIIEESDRRYAVFEMSDIHRNDTVYFQKLADTCFNQEVANAFYTHMLDFDSVGIRKIPDTELRREMMNLSKSTPLKFVDHICEIYDNETSEVSAKDLYEKYTNWCTQNGERSVSATKFGTATKLEKRRTNKGFVYKLPTFLVV